MPKDYYFISLHFKIILEWKLVILCESHSAYILKLLLIFVFRLFLGIVLYANEYETKEK